MKKLVILISPTGKGTNLQAILRATSNKQIQAKAVAVIAESEVSPGLLIAKKANIPTALCKNNPELLPLLKKLKPDYIVLSGWRQFIPKEVLDKYKQKVLNLHPGVIPDGDKKPFKNPDGSDGIWNKGQYGDLAIENFLKQGSTYAGSSVQILTDEFDFGPVLGRTFEKIRTSDTIQSLYSRLKKKEHELYIEVLNNLCQN